MTAPVLTICIPTHEGRARTIGATLASVAEQLRPDQPVTVAVRDNASRDGTDEVVAAAVAAGLPVSYVRNEQNVGYARNLDGVIEQADGEWCWFVSSDDRIQPGALDRVLALLAAHPDVGGMTINQLVLDSDLRAAPWQQTTPAVPPDLQEATVLRDVGDVVAEIGWMMSGVSSLLVRRSAWIADGAPLRARPEHAGSWFPHVAIPLAIAATGTGWLWCPDKLVAVRSGNVDKTVSDSGPRVQGDLLRHLDDTWTAALGGRAGGRARARRRYRRGLERLGNFDEIRADRTRRPRDSAWMLWVFARRFGREPAFWRDDAWRLVAPPGLRRPRLLRRRGAAEVDASVRRDVAAGPPPGATLAGDLPRRARPADMLDIACRVTNDGAAPLSAALALHGRWTSPDGAVVETTPVPLGRPLAPGATRTLRCATNAPLTLGEWELRLALRAGDGWAAGPGDVAATVSVRR
ncbi:MAG TPA: glycosyltransferase family A protein [Baekduia sp.]